MRYIKTILALALFGFSLSASSQCTDPDACNYNQTTVNEVCLSLETVQVHTTGDLAGKTTYRLYVNFPADQDYYMSAVAGNDGTTSEVQPLTISTTTSFYQDVVGSEIGTSINEVLFSTFPDLEYDSWVTIIGENSDFEKEVQTLQDSNEPWLTSFSLGGNITMNTTIGGTWFIIGQNPDQNGGNVDGVIGPSTSVLIAQLTTDGTINAQVSVQYFDNDGVTGDNLIANLSLSNACSFGECVYPQTGFDCDGQCVSGDTDGDGICDEFEVIGCTDANACNYNVNATDSDQTVCDFSCITPVSNSEPCNNQTTYSYNGVDYDLVEIDGICWFAEDLVTTTYNNNAPIEEVIDAEAWSSLTPTDGAKMTYFTDDGFGSGYRSYNWYAVETGLLCPQGWHVANNRDWNSLEKAAFNARSHKLSKQTELIQGNVQSLYDLDWFGQYDQPNVFASLIFSGGLRENVDGKWRDSESSIYWWTAEEYTPKAYESKRANSGWARGVKEGASWGRFRDLWSTSNSKNNALRVRCVKGGIETGGLVEGSFYSVYISPGATSINNYDVGFTYNVGDTLYQDSGLQNPYSYGFKVSNDYGDRLVTDRNGVLVLDPDTLSGAYGGGGAAVDPQCAYCLETYNDGSCFIVEKCAQNSKKDLSPSEICAQFDLSAATIENQNGCSWGVWVGADQERMAKYELASKLARIGYRLRGDDKNLDGTRVDILPFEVEYNRRKENTVSNEDILRTNHFIQVHGLYFGFVQNNGEDFLRLEISPLDEGATLPQSWDDINIFTEIGLAKPGELCSCYEQVGTPPACSCYNYAYATTRRHGDCPSVCASHGACNYNCCDAECGYPIQQ